MKIRIDTDIINEEYRNIEVSADKINTNLNNIDSLVNELGNYWQGSDYDNFKLDMSKFISHFSEINAILNRYQCISDYGNDLRNLEDEVDRDGSNFNE